jgi:hypothetical protein
VAFIPLKDDILNEEKVDEYKNSKEYKKFYKKFSS